MPSDGWPPESCLQALRDVAARLGHSPSLAEYREHRTAGPGGRTIARHFGSWNAAKRAADLPVDEPGNSTPNWRRRAEQAGAEDAPTPGEVADE